MNNKGVAIVDMTDNNMDFSDFNKARGLVFMEDKITKQVDNDIKQESQDVMVDIGEIDKEEDDIDNQVEKRRKVQKKVEKDEKNVEQKDVQDKVKDKENEEVDEKPVITSIDNMEKNNY